MLHEDTFLTIYILVLAGILGAVFGSFLNCMAWRIAHGESVLHGRSHCAVCDHPLGVLDLIPVVSYFALGGKCRYCKEKISPRYVAAEILMAVVFVSLTWRYDISFELLRYLGFACMLLTLSLVDLEIYEIPDGCHIFGILWWAVTIPLVGTPLMEQLKNGLLGGVCIGGGMLLISLLFDKITGKEGMGGGDIKLFFVTGLYLGLAGNLLNLMLSCFVGLLFTVALKQRKIPFGPSIAVSTWLTLLVGEPIINWYLGLFL